MTSELKDFENYNVTSLDYDKNRQAIGVEVILGALSYSTKKLPKDLHVLDAGCGTGNYAAALSTHVGKVTGIELNDGMLAQAKQKTTTLPNVEVQKGNVLSLPFPNEQFDAVICNQVIHHLQPEGSTGYENVAQFVREAYRVLRPSGALIINTCTQEQSATAVWFFQLIPDAMLKYGKKYPSISELKKQINEAGFTLGPALSLVHETLQRSDALFDKEGPFRQEWRNGDSIWAVLSPEELQSTLTMWRKTLDEGKGDEFIAKCEEHRMRIGCSTSVVGYK